MKIVSVIVIVSFALLTLIYCSSLAICWYIRRQEREEPREPTEPAPIPIVSVIIIQPDNTIGVGRGAS